MGRNAWVSISEFLLTNKLRAALKYSCYFSTSFIRINTKSGNKITFINKLRLSYNHELATIGDKIS